MREIHCERGDTVFVWRPTIAEMALVLSHTFGRHSPSRADLLADQIREILQPESDQQLVCVAAAVGTPNLDDSVIAIAVLTPGNDTACILHVDWAYPASLHQRSRSTVGQGLSDAARSISELHAGALWQEMAAVFSVAGVRFVQWTTDPVSPRIPGPQSVFAPSAATRWPTAMDFTQIGTLQYLSFDFIDGGAAEKWGGRGQGGVMDHDHRRVHFQSLDPMDETKKRAFENLVERTYVDSLDCPPLSQFLTASGIIQSYRNAEAYAPELWFTVEALDDASEDRDAIGCVILARYPASSARIPEQINPACVVELVYMGIVPEHRGRDYGQLIMQTVSEMCKQQGAERLILAVDETNSPAIAAYRRFGMLHLFRETMWGRQV